MNEWILPVETREWVGPVTVTVDGTNVTNFEITVTKDAARPLNWKTPLVIGSGRGVMVGDGTDFPLEFGHKYTVWTRYTSTPEVPVNRAGTIKVQ